MYTSLEEVLPKIQRLWDVAQQSASKEGHIVAKQRLAEIIQVPLDTSSSACAQC